MARVKVALNTHNLSAAARRRSSGSGNLVLPLSESAAHALPLRLQLNGQESELVGSDLADASLCASLSVQERQNIAHSVRHYIESLLASAPAQWMGSVYIDWKPHLIGMFGRSAQVKLERQGLALQSRRVCLQTLMADAFEKFNDVMVALALSEPVSWRVEDLVDLKVEDGGDSKGRRTRITKFSLHPPRDWRWEGPAGEQFTFDGRIELNRADPRFGWWLAVLVKAHDDKGLATTGVGIRDLASNSLEIGGHGLHAIAMALVDGVEQASEMTVRQEIESIANCIGRLARDPERAAGVITTRYGCNGQVKSLEACADPIGISRQSVFAQIRLCRSLTKNGGWTPALKKLTEEVKKQSGRPMGNVEADVRGLLGEQQSLQGALSFGKEFFELSIDATLATYQLVTSRELTGVIGRSRVEAYKAVGEAIVKGLRGTGFANTASLVESARTTASEGTLQDALEEVVRTLGNVGWSDPTRRWLVMQDKGSKLCTCVRKLLRVAWPGVVGDDEMVCAVRRWMDRLGVDPQPSRTALISICDSVLEVIGGSRVQDGLKLLEAGDSVVSSIQDEVTVYDILVGRGGECEDVVFEAAPEKIRRAATTAPFLIRSMGSVRLVGWPSKAVVGGRPETSVRQGNANVFSREGNVARVTVTQSAATKPRANNRIVYLPREAESVIQGEFVHQEKLWPHIRVAENRVWRLAGLLSSLGVKAGERLELAFDLKGKTYWLPGRA